MCPSLKFLSSTAAFPSLVSCVPIVVVYFFILERRGFMRQMRQSWLLTPVCVCVCVCFAIVLQGTTIAPNSLLWWFRNASQLEYSAEVVMAMKILLLGLSLTTLSLRGEISTCLV